MSDDTSTLLGTESPFVAERAALLNGWHEVTSDGVVHHTTNDKVTKDSLKASFGLGVTFTKHDSHVTNLGVDLPEGYIISVTKNARFNEELGHHVYTDDVAIDKSIGSRAILVAMRDIFTNRGITPNVQITKDGVWVSAESIDKLIERGVYNHVDFNDEGHIFARALLSGKHTDRQAVLGKTRAILEQGKIDPALATLDHSEKIAGSNSYYQGPELKVDTYEAWNHVREQTSHYQMAREFDAALLKSCIRNKGMAY